MRVQRSRPGRGTSVPPTSWSLIKPFKSCFLLSTLILQKILCEGGQGILFPSYKAGKVPTSWKLVLGFICQPAGISSCPSPSGSPHSQTYCVLWRTRCRPKGVGEDPQQMSIGAQRGGIESEGNRRCLWSWGLGQVIMSSG